MSSIEKRKVNILQFRTIKSATKQFATENNIEALNRAFLGLVLRARLDLDEYDIEDSIIDGSLDGGIDAVYIDDPGTGKPTVYLFQSKFYEKEEKFDKNFEGGALTKMKEAIDAFILSKKRNKSYQNSMLQDKLNDIDKQQNPLYKIIFCSNSDHSTPIAKEQFEDFIDELDKHKEYFSIEYLHLAEIAELLAPKQKRKINTELNFEGKYINDDRGDVRMFLGQISADKIAKLREREGEDLFDKNVRGYLSRRNEINKKIQETATGDDSAYFMYLNNGLTISCDDYNFSPTKESPILEIKNLQIVNGGQTTNSIHEAYKAKKLKTDATLLVKILQIKKKDDLLEKIILATNNQTKVTSRDLRSNSDIQKLIEREMQGYGYYYEARKDKYKSVKEAKNKRVDAEVAAQAYYAAIKKDPAQAKNKKGLLFSDYYDQIFNDQINSQDLLLAYLLFKEVRDLNKKYGEKYSFVNDASLHTVAMLFSLGVKKLDDLDEEKNIEKKYKKILIAINEVVKEKIKEEEDAYSHRKTFIDSVTLGRITEAYKDKNR